MRKWQEMSESDVSVILKLRVQGEKLQTIAALLKRSVSTVSRVVNGKRGPNVKTRSGRPKKFSGREARHLVRAVIIRKESASQAHSSVDVAASVRTVQRTLNNHLKISWNNMKHTMMMNKKHHISCIEWAREKAWAGCATVHRYFKQQPTPVCVQEPPKWICFLA